MRVPLYLGKRLLPSYIIRVQSLIEDHRKEMPKGKSRLGILNFSPDLRLKNNGLRQNNAIT